MENVINELFKSIDNFIVEKVEDFKRNKYSSFNKMLEPFSIRYEENKAFGGRTKQETEEYNEFQLKGFGLYKNCNFDKELERNINKHIAEYTKFFLNIKDKDIMTVSPMKKIYPSAYYEHCRSYKILVDNKNKSLLLLKK
ncbi:hypothetical protein [Paraclostridium sordellii]|uniref:hypothetical protein n=1 Tax=Paraclostridium sordellii TaxID=1505 RepID=UPI000E53F67C|nr:hypothetical protein [Paeniclostridium sordellii]RGX02695.1 hypothetical protein DWV40_14820 [Paeniclostridium sordellii]